MANITAWVRPTYESEADLNRKRIENKYRSPGATGAHAHLVIDGVDIWVSDPLTPAALRDAGIVSTCNMLIGVLVGLRDEAARRIAVTEAELADWAPGEIVAVFGR